MNFVFDIDGTLCFDGMSLSKEIQGILERAQIDYGHRVTFATARSYRDTIGYPWRQAIFIKNYWFKWCDFT